MSVYCSGNYKQSQLLQQVPVSTYSKPVQPVSHHRLNIEQATASSKNYRRPVCKVEVIHLPRHLRNCYGWTAEKARSAVLSFKLRATSTVKSRPKYRDHHKLQRCPVVVCSVSVKRLSSHLLSHRIVKVSLQYKQLLATARMRTATSCCCRRKSVHASSTPSTGQASDVACHSRLRS